MLGYLLRRLGFMILTLFFIITLTFFGMKIIPSGPFSSEKVLPVAIKANLDKKYHFNDPLWKQYTDYLGRVVRWDLGPSFKYESRTVNEIVDDGFPVSASLGAVAVLLALGAGLLAGAMAALRQYGWQDYLGMVLATVGFSVPSFILAGLLQFIFAYKLHLLPSAMWGHPAQVILPALSLAALPTAMIARLMRSSMLEVLQQDYIRTARAKGLKDRVIVYRHGMKNALIPVVTYLGPLMAAIFTGSFIVEWIYTIPGLGRYFVMSVQNRDYTVVMGITVFYSVLLMFANLAVDLSYAFLDPRVRLAGERK
ncbi:MAG: ABC transporter permease [Bacillota bacterium]